MVLSCQKTQPVSLICVCGVCVCLRVFACVCMCLHVFACVCMCVLCVCCVCVCVVYMLCVLCLCVLFVLCIICVCVCVLCVCLLFVCVVSVCVLCLCVCCVCVCIVSVCVYMHVCMQSPVIEGCLSILPKHVMVVFVFVFAGGNEPDVPAGRARCQQGDRDQCDGRVSPLWWQQG